jgi:hypothetical protein
MGTNPIDPNDPAVIAAEKRCTKAQSSYKAYERTIGEIITAQDWKTLGYNTFIDFWVDRFGKIAPTWDMIPHVVYEMLAEGNTNDAITAAVIGVGPERVANLRRQKTSGTPAVDADPDSKPRRPKGRADDIVFLRPGLDFKAYGDSLAVAGGIGISDLIIAAMIQVHGRP